MKYLGVVTSLTLLIFVPSVLASVESVRNACYLRYLICSDAGVEKCECFQRLVNCTDVNLPLYKDEITVICQDLNCSVMYPSCSFKEKSKEARKNNATMIASIVSPIGFVLLLICVGACLCMKYEDKIDAFCLKRQRGRDTSSEVSA